MSGEQFRITVRWFWRRPHRGGGEGGGEGQIGRGAGVCSFARDGCVGGVEMARYLSMSMGLCDVSIDRSPLVNSPCVSCGNIAGSGDELVPQGWCGPWPKLEREAAVGGFGSPHWNPCPSASRRRCLVSRVGWRAICCPTLQLRAAVGSFVAAAAVAVRSRWWCGCRGFEMSKMTVAPIELSIKYTKQGAA